MVTKIGKWIILLSCLGCILVFGDYNDPRRDFFYRYNSKFSLSYLFGYLPQKYYDDYSEEVLEEHEFFELKGIVSLKLVSNNYDYLIFKDKKDYNLEAILYDRDSILWYISGVNKLLISQINQTSFEKYLGYKEIYSQEKKMNEFFRIIANFDSKKFEIIENTRRIEEIRIIKNDSGLCYPKLKKEFIPNFKRNIYVWFEEIGLFEIDRASNIGELKDELIFGPITLMVMKPENCL